MARFHLRLLQYSILLTTIGLMLGGCLEKIDLEVERGYEEALAINGKLVVGDPAYIEVGIERLFDFTANARKRVNVREVLLINAEKQSIPLELGQAADQYALRIPADHPTFAVSTREKYKIRVTTFDDRVFESAFEYAPPVPRPLQLRADTIEERVYDQRLGLYENKGFYVVSLNTPVKTPDSAEKSRLLWDAVKPVQIAIGDCNQFNTIILTEPLLFDGTAVLRSELNGFQITKTRIDGFNRERVCMTLLQQSLSESAFAYWQRVRELMLRNGSMFEAYPGEIQSNIVNVADPDDLVYGFFYVTQQDTIELDR